MVDMPITKEFYNSCLEILQINALEIMGGEPESQSCFSFIPRQR